MNKEKSDLSEEWENLAERVGMAVLENGEMSEASRDILTVPCLNLKVAFWVLKEVEEGKRTFLFLKKDFLRQVELKDLIQAAERNTPKIWHPTLGILSEMISERVLGEGNGEYSLPEMVEKLKKKPYDGDALVLGSQGQLFGSVYILYGEILRTIAETVKDDLYIAAPCKHEALLFGVSKQKLSLPDFCDMTKGLYDEDMGRNEILTDAVYLYRREEQSLCLIDRYGKILDCVKMGTSKTALTAA